MEADKDKRAKYLKKIEKIAPENRVYIDESGIEGNLSKDRAWGKRGEIIQATKSGKYYLRTNIVAGLVKNKCIAPFVFYGPCNTALFNDWIRTFLLKELKPGQTIIMDNAAFHKSKETEALLESVGCKLLFLPPYSPDLNPIEIFWANMKRWVKSKWNQQVKVFELLCLYFSVPFKS